MNFFFSFNKLLKSCKYKYIFYILFCIQISAHIYLLFTNNQCNPQVDNLCNIIALLIGFIYLFLLYLCKNINIDIYFFISLFVIFYIILSHIITINPINNSYIYENKKYNIF